MRARQLALILAAKTEHESKRIKTRDLCLGEGLTDVVRAALARLSPGKTISSIICDINGERYRSEEWGFVCLRLASYFDDPTAYLAPSACWGDVGAASIPLFVMLACEAAGRGYATGPRVLAYAGSENGLRGALALQTIEGP
jgi:3-oxoacyl-[acyl-carrier-protein] synthase-1